MEIRVGEIYIPAKNIAEGSHLSLDESGIFLLLNFANATQKEVSCWAKNSIEFSFVVKDGLFFLLVKVDEQQWIDAPYAPQIARSYLNFTNIPIIQAENTKGYSFVLVLTDRLTGEIKATRMVGLGHDFSIALKYTLDTIMDNSYSFSLQEYYQKLTDIYSQFTTDDLVSLAKKHYPENYYSVTK